MSSCYTWWLSFEHFNIAFTISRHSDVQKGGDVEFDPRHVKSVESMVVWLQTNERGDGLLSLQQGTIEATAPANWWGGGGPRWSALPRAPAGRQYDHPSCCSSSVAGFEELRWHVWLVILKWCGWMTGNAVWILVTVLLCALCPSSHNLLEKKKREKKKSGKNNEAVISGHSANPKQSFVYCHVNRSGRTYN